MKNCDLMLVRLMGRQVVSCHTKLKRKKRKKSAVGVRLDGLLFCRPFSLNLAQQIQGPWHQCNCSLSYTFL